MMQFELPKDKPSIIKVIGIGGGGSNAVNHMFRQGIRGVEFLVCNTDHQALETSPIPDKIQLGPSLTEGRGAGSLPEVGKNAAIENLEDIRKVLSGNTKMVFITAGMGGGTGTGAAPIIAGVAREMGILTVAIVTVPFGFEGKKRKQQAEAGIEELKKNVDTLLVICNDKLREIHGNLKLAEAFSYADNVLATAAKSIAEIISVTLHINVDFADVQTVMKESGVAIMGSAVASGDDRAMKAVELALDSPLLNDNNIEGARYILLNITSGSQEITMDEMGEITDFIQEQAGQSAEVIMGVGTDESLGEKICVTIIATGFKTKERIKTEKPAEKVVYKLADYVVPPVEEKKIEPAAEHPSEPFLKSTEKIAEEINLIEADEDKVYEEEIPEPVLISPMPVEEDKEEEIQAFVFEEEEEDEVEVKKENVFKFDLITSAPIVDVPKENKIEKEEVKEEKKEEPVMQKPFVPAFEEVQNIQEEKLVEQQAPVEDPHEELFRRSRERIMKLKEMSYRMNTPNGLTDLEKEPAYKRRNIKLDEVNPSNNPSISKYSLSEDKDKNVEIKPNNFLHDRVD
jgi:cell division protein FtsZ